MTVIEVQNLTKIFYIPTDKNQSFLRSFKFFPKNFQLSENQKLVALDNISFTIQKGECVGLIGKNGSGKTTLLKIIAGILEPTSGLIKIKGKIAPYLSLNVGFHSELTAEENIYLYGSILGLNSKEIKEKLDQILLFAELEKFKKVKIKYFSSGMIARLAFAVMVQVKSDILLLDEILAVGDKDFVPKCLEIIANFKKEKTIIIASHYLSLIQKLCPRTLLLDHGQLKMFDNTSKVIEYYLQS